jgi:uncharacterized protein with HEPN domain
MRDAAMKAVAFVADKFRKQLDEDEKLSLALVRLVEIIGEAASKVSPEFQARHSDIQWRDIIGTRNRLIHAYDAVNLDILWKIVREDLPPLITSLQRAIGEEASGADRESF